MLNAQKIKKSGCGMQYIGGFSLYSFVIQPNATKRINDA
jgi:hypothetical protein